MKQGDLFRERIKGWNILDPDPPNASWGINFGGGVNSTALLLLARERDLKPDWVLFADTGSERPETYENVDRVSRWCKDVGYPFEIVKWIRQDGTFESVHENSLRTGYLPSKAYGNAGCTYKWKIHPMSQWRNRNGYRHSVVAIGYDVGEKARVLKAKKACDDAEYDPSLRNVWYPLIAWGIDRAACEDVIRKQGWPASKSSCFLCPHMRESEWKSLQDSHPHLFKIAVDVENGAKAAGHADTASIFKRAGGTCLCLADECTIPEKGEDIFGESL